MIHMHMDTVQVLTLPEGEEDDRLHHEELEHGVVRHQQVTGSEVEQEQGVQRQADRDVVHDGDVQVTAGNAAGGGGERVSDSTQIDSSPALAFG